jgi:hypothetical protein
VLTREGRYGAVPHRGRDAVRAAAARCRSGRQLPSRALILMPPPKLDHDGLARYVEDVAARIVVRR